MAATTPGEALVWKLKSVGAITALVGTRIFYRQAPQTAVKPYIVVDHPPGQRRTDRTLSGTVVMVQTHLMIRVEHAEKSIVAMQIAKLCVSAIEATTSATWDSFSVLQVDINDVYDDSAPPQQLADEIGFPAAAIDLTLYHLNC